jgi:hypothetical protein
VDQVVDGRCGGGSAGPVRRGVHGLHALGALVSFHRRLATGWWWRPPGRPSPAVRDTKFTSVLALADDVDTAITASAS